jgi:GTPase
LIEAFGATLEEAAQADLLFHVVDIASTNREAQITQVNKVLHEIGANKVPQILILNQIDRMDCESGFDRDEHGRIVRIRASAKTGGGLDLIRLALQEHYAYLKKLSTEKSAYA